MSHKYAKQVYFPLPPEIQGDECKLIQKSVDWCNNCDSLLPSTPATTGSNPKQIFPYPGTRLHFKYYHLFALMQDYWRNKTSILPGTTPCKDSFKSRPFVQDVVCA
jgi:hypothetical protein